MNSLRRTNEEVQNDPFFFAIREIDHMAAFPTGRSSFRSRDWSLTPFVLTTQVVSILRQHNINVVRCRQFSQPVCNSSFW